MATAIKTVTNRLERTAGDTYPIQATIKVDGEPVDITGDTLTFEFSNDTVSPIIIIGNLTDPTNGIVEFVPSGAEMMTGEYNFVVKRVHSGVIATHSRGTLVLLADV